ncbi:hypothetical protein BC830DRAFT_59936 [Chytriomyces sp. MP71]|nr:hypothetical protein BC830DRAFT_59936 [Chytriomyces sp. MP71]
MPRPRVTILITSSPIPSHPSNIVLATVIASMRRHLRDGAGFRVVVVFDGCSETTKESAFKRGKVSIDERSNYDRFVDESQKTLLSCRLKCWDSNNSVALASLSLESPDSPEPVAVTTNSYISANCPQLCLCSCEQAGYDVNPVSTTSVTLEPFLKPSSLEITECVDHSVACIRVLGGKPLGQAIAVREALKHVETEYVLAAQHDWRFSHDLDIGRFLSILDLNDSLNYLGFISRRTAGYAAVARPASFPTSILESSAFPGCEGTDSLDKIPLCRSFFWFDKNHLARTSFYRDTVFSGRFRFKRGDFIEDTMGHVMLGEIKAAGIADGPVGALEAWRKWGCVLFYPQNGSINTLVHVNGRQFLSTEAREELARKGRDNVGMGGSSSDSLLSAQTV